MGTRSLTHFRQGDKTLLTLYRQFDGYIEGHGKDLAEALQLRHNGFGCLVAQVVGKLKGGKAFNVYVFPADSVDCSEEFTYYVESYEGFKVDNIKVVDDSARVCFEGSLEAFIEFTKAERIGHVQVG